jgi:hypothetical protein
MLVDGGNQNQNGSTNIPSHNSLGYCSLQYFVNQFMFEGEFSVFDSGLFKQFQTIYRSRIEFRSLFKDRLGPSYVSIQLNRELLQSFGGVAGMEISTPCPWMKEQGGAGCSGAAVGSQHEGNGSALNGSGCMNFNWK